MPTSVRHLLVISLTLTGISSGCGSGSRAHDGPLFGTGVFHPPPKPGASISQTRMCDCQACAPRACCDGPEDDAPNASCGQNHDFTGYEDCTISIRSCASRCIR